MLNVPSNHRVGAERDTKIYELHTHTLSKQRLIAYSMLQERDGTTPDYHVLLQWNVTRSSWKPWLFGLLSAVAALGVLGVKVATDNLQTLTLTRNNYIIGGGSLVLVAAAAGALYWLFNKK